MAIAALLPLLAAGCAAGHASEAAPSHAAAPGDPVTGELVVLAAASLADVFGRLSDRFEDAHPGVRVQLGLGGSSSLARQVLDGAPADVLATADTATMDTVVEGLRGQGIGTPTRIATNALEIAVPAGNPADVDGLADLADPALAVALCAPEVPCGAAARRAFDTAGVSPAPDTLESDVSAVLTKVRLGEVDAALVYRTDVLRARDEVEGVPFPEAPVNDYPVVVLPDARNPAAARAFADLVLSDEGRQVLRDAGFDVPAATDAREP